MKAIAPQLMHVTPEAKGWRLYRSRTESRTFEDMGELAATIPAKQQVHLSLPTHFLLLERMKFPSTEMSELSEMALFQLEKTLPFPVQDVSSGVLVASRDENSSTLLSVAVRRAALEILCAPLRDRGVTLRKITPYVARVAAACPPEEVVLVIYPEQEHAVVAIADRARLVWAQAIPVGDAITLIDDLPGALLIAEMEGANAQFSRVLVAEDCHEWLEALGAHFPVPVEKFSLAEPLPDAAVDLVPMSWRHTTERHRRGAQLKRRALFAAGILLAIVIGAAAYLVWLKIQVARIDAECALVRPRVEALRSSQARWMELEPAIDPDHATIELLYQLCKNIPQATLHLTEFDQTLIQWKVYGEAPSASVSIDYLAKLRSEKELSAFHITASPPVLLPNDQAQFSIFGKR